MSTMTDVLEREYTPINKGITFTTMVIEHLGRYDFLVRCDQTDEVIYRRRTSDADLLDQIAADAEPARRHYVDVMGYEEREI